MTIPHVAFRSSDILHEKTDGFIRRMHGGASRPEPKEIEAIMGIFIDEALTAFLTRAAEAAQLSPGMMKVVRMTTQTISKTTHLVVSRSAKKLDLQQNRAAADYMDLVRQPAPGEDFWYVAFPVDEEMAALGKSLPRKGAKRAGALPAGADRSGHRLVLRAAHGLAAIRPGAAQVGQHGRGNYPQGITQPDQQPGPQTER